MAHVGVMILSKYQRASLNGVTGARARMERTGLTAAGQPLWSAEELGLLRAHAGDLAAAIEALPDRSGKAVRAKAQSLGMRPRRRVWAEPEVAHVIPRYPTTEPVAAIGAAVGKSRKQVWAKAGERKLRRPRRRPLPAADPLVDAIRQRAFDLGISLCGLDLDVRQGRYFALREPPKNRLAVSRAVRLLGGRFEVTFP